MKFIIDMVHHNPGEALFDSEFLRPEKLARYGFNGQVSKQINFSAKFTEFDKDIIPQGSEENAWITQYAKKHKKQLEEAKKKNLLCFSHIDLFVLPKRLVEKYREEICYEGTYRIAIEKEKTLEVHRALFKELFEKFSELDGLIVRVGETYLFDTPYHMGNGPIRSVQYEQSQEDEAVEKNRYVQLINFLREEICVKHGKYLMFRTWDCYPDKFHANLQYYLDVTEKIQPHEKLLFSIKHTALDFWRRVKFNECITQGKHNQLIEVQCQREYEGKGAYPNYIMDGIINGFEENARQKGLKDVVNSPLIKGIYTWTRGGGWYGPYIENELWCDLNAYVIAQYVRNTEQSEEKIFAEYAKKIVELEGKDIETFRKICLLSTKAILKGRYCEAYDKSLNESILPTNLWMRDDRLGGIEQLRPVFEYLWEHELFESAIKEKYESVEIWREIKYLSSQIHTGDTSKKDFINISSEYGLLLYTIVYYGWKILINGFVGDKTGKYDVQAMKEDLNKYDESWRQFKVLQDLPMCPTIYSEMYLNLPGEPEVTGIGHSLQIYRQLVK